VRLSRAAATSSAVPVVLSPVTFNNYGGKCGFRYPAWVRAVADPEKRVRPSGRALQRYREMQDFQKSEERPYIHLVDGGVLEAIQELAEASVPKVTLEVLDVSFDAIADPQERDYFMNLPTSFVLEPEEVDRLREVAGRVLRQSEAYESVLRDLGGIPAE